MDTLDKTTILVVAVLIIVTAVLVLKRAPEERSALRSDAPHARTIKRVDRELDNRIRKAKDLLAAGNLQTTELLIKDLLAEFPYEGTPYMVLGDLLMRKQAPVEAMLEYRKGLDLNPDFLDKKTPVFQGKKIKVVLKEAGELIFNGLKRDPNDVILKLHRKTFYYMQRRVAGSCG